MVQIAAPAPTLTQSVAMPNAFAQYNAPLKLSPADCVSIVEAEAAAVGETVGEDGIVGEDVVAILLGGADDLTTLGGGTVGIDTGTLEGREPLDRRGGGGVRTKDLSRSAALCRLSSATGTAIATVVKASNDKGSHRGTAFFCASLSPKTD